MTNEADGRNWLLISASTAGAAGQPAGAGVAQAAVAGGAVPAAVRAPAARLTADVTRDMRRLAGRVRQGWAAPRGCCRWRSPIPPRNSAVITELNAARDAEYAEVLDRLPELHRELADEQGPGPPHLRRGRGVRSRPAPLPRPWLAKIEARDYFVGPRSATPPCAVVAAATAVAGRVRERRAGRRDTRAGPGRRTRPVRAAGGGRARDRVVFWLDLLIGAGTCALLLAWLALVVGLAWPLPARCAAARGAAAAARRAAPDPPPGRRPGLCPAASASGSVLLLVYLAHADRPDPRLHPGPRLRRRRDHRHRRAAQRRRAAPASTPSAPTGPAPRMDSPRSPGSPASTASHRDPFRVGCVHDDVRPEWRAPRNGRGYNSQPIECCGGEHVNGGAIEERVMWEIEIRQIIGTGITSDRLAYARQQRGRGRRRVTPRARRLVVQSCTGAPLTWWSAWNSASVSSAHMAATQPIDHPLAVAAGLRPARRSAAWTDAGWPPSGGSPPPRPGWPRRVRPPAAPTASAPGSGRRATRTTSPPR